MTPARSRRTIRVMKRPAQVVAVVAALLALASAANATTSGTPHWQAQHVGQQAGPGTISRLEYQQLQAAQGATRWQVQHPGTHAIGRTIQKRTDQFGFRHALVTYDTPRKATVQIDYQREFPGAHWRMVYAQWCPPKAC
jgi:hypothetical protein